MKIGASGSTFNLGDTSFRRKTLMADYKEILPILQRFKKENPIWKKGNQGDFYSTVIASTELFNRKSNEDFNKRGRTLTNPLIKLGLVNESRDLGEAAINWIEDESKSFDDLESWLSLTVDNIVLLRQMLKLKVYIGEGEHFYPFRFAIKFLSTYNNVPEKNLLKLLHIVNPSSNEIDLNKIIEDYKKVEDGNELFEEYLRKIDVDQFDSSEAEKVTRLFLKDYVDEKYFSRFFSNQKSGSTITLYYEFYLKLDIYKSKSTIENLKALIEISKNSKIEKAFGFNKSVFNYADSPDEFNQINMDNPLLSEDKTQFYYRFIRSKKEDLISEYSDITKRTFNLTGIFSFSNNLVNLVHVSLFQELIKEMGSAYKMQGNDDYKAYEKDLGSSFYKDLTFKEILEISDEKIDIISSKLVGELGIEKTESLKNFYIKENEQRMNDMIEKYFSKEKIIELLRLLVIRDSKSDQELKNYISDNATIPTIFEYLLGIAWSYLSQAKYGIRDSMKLSLDGNLRPLTHAPGGNGDIEINYSDTAILIEATLMNKNAQKRGELEPVIRHTANLAVEKKPMETFAVFIADELDTNVVNIFRAMSIVNLESTKQRGGFIPGISIFSLKISEVIELLEKNITETKIFEVLRNSYNTQLNIVSDDWRENIYNKILNE